MQRPIKFRAWDTKELRWLDQENPHDFIIMPEDGGVVELGSSYGVPTVSLRKSAILMQYTGLKDKNGVEIYEGDIMRGDDNYEPEIYGEFNVHQVRFGEMVDTRYGWYLEDYRAAMSRSTFEEFEVIGNIYENPELLNGNKE